MHGDAGEEEDGAVEVEVKEEADEAAHEVPEHPAVPEHVARHQEGQRQTVHQVGGGQVHHVDQRGVPASPTTTAAAAAATVVAAGAQQHHRVEGEAEQEGQRVADGQEDILVGFVNAAGRRRDGRGARGVGMDARHRRHNDVWSNAGGLAQSHDEGYFWQSWIGSGSSGVISAPVFSLTEVSFICPSSDRSIYQSIYQSINQSNLCLDFPSTDPCPWCVEGVSVTERGKNTLSLVWKSLFRVYRRRFADEVCVSLN